MRAPTYRLFSIIIFYTYLLMRFSANTAILYSPVSLDISLKFTQMRPWEYFLLTPIFCGGNGARIRLEEPCFLTSCCCWEHKRLFRLCSRFTLSFGRRMHEQSMPRRRHLRHQSHQRFVHMQLCIRIQRNRLLGGHQRVRTR